MTKGAAFTLRSTSFFPGGYAIFADCGVCDHCIIVEVVAYPSDDPADFRGAEALFDHFTILRSFPEPPRIEVMDALPPQVATPYLEAEHARTSGHLGSAGRSYRTAVERSLKILDPEASGMLNARIRAMEGTLPADLIRLLDQVKLFGNSSAHDLEDPTIEDIEAAQDFTRLFFLYTFDLRAKLDRAIAKRDAAKATKAI